MHFLSKVCHFGFVCLMILSSGVTNPIDAQPVMNDFPVSSVKLVNDNHDGFVVIAHRGAGAYYPENTMIAFRSAYEMGAEMIELDVTLSKDGIPVVIHDEDLDRTTNGKGKVADKTLKELKELDAGSWFDSKFQGERIPTLEEVLEFASGKISLNIEIKPETVTDTVHGGVEERVLSLVKEYEMEQYVLFSSFDYRAIEHLKALDVDIYGALLYNEPQSRKRSPSKLVQDYQANAFNCSYRQYSKKWADELKNAQIPVYIYTVNSKRTMKKVIGRGVSGIFTDKPDVLKELVDNMWKTK